MDFRIDTSEINTVRFELVKRDGMVVFCPLNSYTQSALMEYDDELRALLDGMCMPPETYDVIEREPEIRLWLIDRIARDVPQDAPAFDPTNLPPDLVAAYR